MSKSIDITPPMTVYDTFRNYSYKVDTAMAEFIDNSISSFRKNWKIVEDNEKKGIVVEKSIIIIFDRQSKQVIIRDSAFGIAEEDYERALRIKSTPKDTKGLNEFGMGLKTAAFWFGKSLQIITNSPFDHVGDYAKGAKLELTSADIRDEKSSIVVQPYDASASAWKINHGTVIKISEVDRELSNQLAVKCATSIGNKYRRDILNKKIEIYVYVKEVNGKLLDINNFIKTGEKTSSYIEGSNLRSGKSLTHEMPEIFFDKKTKKEVRVKFNLSIENNGKKYPVKGEIFMRKKGSRKEAGIDLFRRGRIIVEKFTEFWPDQSSYKYQRINGHIDLDDFPVTQAKDRIDWEGSLYEKVKEELLKNSHVKYVEKFADEYRARADNETSDLEKTDYEFRKKTRSLNMGGNSRQLTKVETKELAQEMMLNHSDTDYAHKIMTEKGEIKIYSRLVLDGSMQAWLNVKKINDELILVELDVNHIFFNPFNDLKENGKFSERFINIIRQFAVFWAYSEEESIFLKESADEFRERLSELIENNKGE